MNTSKLIFSPRMSFQTRIARSPVSLLVGQPCRARTPHPWERHQNRTRRLAGAEGQEVNRHLNDEELQRHLASPEHRSRSSSHEAGHAVLAEYFHHEVIDVRTDGETVPEGSPEAMLVSGGKLGATGGETHINWAKMDMNHPAFDDHLRNIATVFMGGRAAEELTHHEKIEPDHWKADIAHFKQAAGRCRTESQMDELLEEGYRRAKDLLQHLISKQHKRVRDCLFADERCSRHPNGKFVRRVMKGLS